jgi:hypothetical protein
MKKRVDLSDETPDIMPSSITELQPLVFEFIGKLKRIKNEQELLKTEERDLFEEYKNKIDMKEFKAAMKVASIKEKVSHKDAFDNILECIERGE